MRKGQTVEVLTKTVGQPPRTGVVVDIRDEEFVEVEWEDGHTSVISQTALNPVEKAKSSKKGSS